MLKFNQNLGIEGMLALIQRTCNHVDSRLMDHGLRVSYIVSKILKHYDEYDAKEVRDICFLTMLHDIGAYKTEEIDRMVEFETKAVWEHSVYGYLFLKYFSPLGEFSQAVLLHHVKAENLDRMMAPDVVSPRIREIAQIIHLADRADIFLDHVGEWDDFLNRLPKWKGTWFGERVLNALSMEKTMNLEVSNIGSDPDFIRAVASVPLNTDEINAYIGMLVCAIDFRSRHTVTHTVTTATIGSELAKLAGLSEKEIQVVVSGAMLHDLGKIGIPVEILEYPGKLSPQAMTVMRTHVDITDEILGDYIAEDVRRVALRHHEKLDGSGYPRGLRGEQLNKMERILAVADIVSALCGTRSYKNAFSKDKTLGIIREMGRNGQLDAELVQLAADHYDEIMERKEERCAPLLDSYQAIQEEYADWIFRFNRPRRKKEAGNAYRTVKAVG